jgi:hypothetical protein
MKNRLPLVLLILALIGGHCTVGQENSEIKEIFNIDENYIEGIGGLSNTWGVLNFRSFPWIHSQSLGWMYLSEASSGEGYWLWSESLSWFFSTSEKFPEIYIQDRGWALLDITELNRVKYWLYETKEWRQTGKVGVNYKPVFDEVPDYLRNIRHEGQGTTIEFGPYYFYHRYVTGLGVITEYFYYDAGDDCFYRLETLAETDLLFLTGSGWERFKVERGENAFTITRLDMVFGSEPTQETYSITSN